MGLVCFKCGREQLFYHFLLFHIILLAYHMHAAYIVLDRGVHGNRKCHHDRKSIYAVVTGGSRMSRTVLVHNISYLTGTSFWTETDGRTFPVNDKSFVQTVTFMDPKL